MKKILSFLMLMFAAVTLVFAQDPETLASGTFDGKNGTYTEGWSTTGTGVGRNDCVVIGADENITSPEVDLSSYESITVSIKARRYGSLTGKVATIAVTFDGEDIGTVDASTTTATTALDAIDYTVDGLTTGNFVFTCSNATSAGSSHGAGINSIVITGVKSQGGTGTSTKETVYLVNASNWTKPTIHMWGGTANGTSWPGMEMTKTSTQLKGADVYSYTADKGAYANCIFSDNGANQTGDLDWTAGKYYYMNKWYSYDELAGGGEIQVDYYLKNNWDQAAAWTWKKTTPVGDGTYKLENVVFGGTGVNWYTEPVENIDMSNYWIPATDFKGDEVAAGNTVTFVFDPKAKTITATLVGGTTPVDPPITIAYDTVYLVNTLGWATPYCYHWGDYTVQPQWPGEAMTKTEDKVGSYDVYMYVAKEGALSKCIFNNGDAENTIQTEDLKPIQDVGKNDKYYVPGNQQDEVGAYIGGTWYATLDAISGNQLAAGFYLIGLKGWTVADLNADLKFAETTTANVYSLTVTLVKDQEFKAVYVNDQGAIANWMPKDGDNFVVTDKYAGEKAVLLNVTGKGGEGWFEGYLYVEPNPDQPIVAAKFYITGDSAFVVDAGLDKAKTWNSDAIASQKDTFELSLKANQAYEMQVIVGEAWKGFTDLTVKPDGVKAGGEYGNNICFSLAEAGTVKVIYFVENEQLTFKVEGKFYVEPVNPPTPTIADGFYLVGTFNSWTPAEGYLFAANPDNEGEYMITATLAENDEFKAVKVENGKYGDGSWYPAEGGNYVVDAAHAGEKVIYFRPEGNTDWGGCFYIAPNEAPEMTVIYDWAGEIGATIFGGNSGITTGTVKIHKNTDNVNGIKFGSSYVYADGKWIAIKPAEGGFKAGDVLSVSVVFNNSDATKYCMVDLRAADGDTRIWMSDSLSTLNGRNEGEPIVQTYTLEADQDSLFLGRYGNTGMFVTLLKVERAAGGDTPEPPVAKKDLYLVPNQWAEGDAKMAAWTWGTELSGEWTSFFAPKAEGNDTLVAKVNAAAENVIFVRFSPEETEPRWEGPNQWNQTPDDIIQWEKGGIFTITGCDGYNCTGTWDVYTPVVPPTPSVIYSVAGSKALLGADWNEKEGNEMTLDAADGLYKLLCADVTLAAGTKYEFKVVTDHDWTKPSYPDANKELYVDQDGKYDVTITFNAETQEVNAVAEFKEGAEVEKHYLIVGDADVAKGKNWDNDAAENLMTSADEGLTYTLVVEKAELLQNKLYGYKVVEKGSWTEYYPNAGGSNAYFSVEESAIYTITYTYTVATSQCAVVTTKSGEIPEPTLANGLYLVGTFNGVSAWTIDDLSAEKMFKATDEEGQYSIDVTLAENDEFKAVYVEADAIQIWYPDGGSNYIVDANHAGQKTIYFRPVFWADWNGHFYVAPNEGPAPEPTYYLKNNWEGAQDWTWKAMTKLDDGSYMLANVVFGGIGVNISTDPSEETPKFIEMKDIETFDAGFDPAQLGALDTVVFFFDPEEVNQYTGANGLTAQIIGKYVEPVTPPTPDPTVVVIGDMNQWDETNPIAFTLSQDKKTASLVVPKIPVGDYNFKLKINGEWRSNGWWFNRNVTSAAGINSNEAADMRLQADVEGQYTFTWTFANDSLDIIFPAKPEQPTLADGFYFVGTANEWTPAEGYMFSKNPDNEAEYMFTTTLAAGDEFKVVYVENGQKKDDQWYPGGEGGNYVVDAAHAGEKTIYFRPDYQGGEDWYCGCIFVLANSGEGFEEIIATDKAAKIIRNGQFFIIKGDKMYNVTGAKIR